MRTLLIAILSLILVSALAGQGFGKEMKGMAPKEPAAELQEQLKQLWSLARCP